MKFKSVFLGMGLLMVLCSVSFAQVPPMINYQGKLNTSAGAPVNGTLQMVFTIYADSNGTTSLWTETQPAVVVDKGVFNVLLGSVDSIPYSVFDGSIRYLGVKVAGDPEITPKKPMVSVPYAYRAGTADGGGANCGWIDDGTVVRLQTSTDNVGIGTVNPGARLHVFTNDYNGGATFEAAKFEHNQINSARWTFSNPKTENGQTERSLSLGVSGNYADFVGGEIGMKSNHPFRLLTNNTEAVRVTTSGNVGIGTTNPDGKLDIFGGGSPATNLVLAANWENKFRWRIKTIDRGNAIDLDLTASDAPDNEETVLQLTRSTSGRPEFAVLTDKLVVNNGNVGIGTASPTARLHVEGEAFISDKATIGPGNTNTGINAFVAGASNLATGSYSAVGGGLYNNASSHNATVGGGYLNTASDQLATVGGGYLNTAGWGATVGGGRSNTASQNYATVGGGDHNIASASDATVGGGSGNTASGHAATVPGGYGNTAVGDYSFASGRLVSVTAANTFAFGNNFTTSTPHAVIFHDTETPIKVGIGTTNPGATLDVRGNIMISSVSTGNTVMTLGEGLDYAEGFDVSNEKEIQPGSVLIIDPVNPGKLAMSQTPYDSKVAGIVAGAKGQGSGVRLGPDQFDFDVALAGRVYCNVDATEIGVEPGDLLTTSATPGYAMKVTDYARAQGSILGKAMEKMEKGKKGQILVLVTLQ
jgi:hypothetical protein